MLVAEIRREQVHMGARLLPCIWMYYPISCPVRSDQTRVYDVDPLLMRWTIFISKIYRFE
jgi:hypothetical protein